MRDQNETPKPVHRRAGDADVLALAEGLASALGRTLDRTDLDVLRTVAESYPDVGRDGAGEVVASLKGLIDDFLVAGAYDREAILVHVRAWRFMVSRKPDKRERLKILSGLREVRDLYAPSCTV
ncbi:hypothetical protein [Phenylobacterium sp.]|uniref:hypothetical protein n=1 Tax=Phenylobacterium sp. TaxID=1871053 RepID=UPI00301BB3F2